MQHNVAWAEVYLVTKWHLDPSSLWPKQAWAENCGGRAVLLGVELGPHLTQC